VQSNEEGEDAVFMRTFDASEDGGWGDGEDWHPHQASSSCEGVKMGREGEEEMKVILPHDRESVVHKVSVKKEKDKREEEGKKVRT